MELKYFVKFLYRFGTSFLEEDTKDKVDSAVGIFGLVFVIFI